VTTLRDIRLDRSSLPLLALLFAPVVLRGVLLADLAPSASVQDLRGVLSDLAIALLLLPAVFAAGRLTRWIGVAIVAGWTLLQYANYETVVELGSLASALDLRFLGDSTFLLGSALEVARPVLLGALLVAGAVAVRLAPAAVPWLHSGASLAVGAALAMLLALWPWSDEVALWRQTNVVQRNLNLLVRPSDGPARSAFRDPPSAMLALDPQLAADLGGRSFLGAGPRARNVILVSLESVAGAFIPTLAADHGHSDLFSLPELDALARDHLSYSTFINHNRKTNRGMYTLVCGEPPNLLPGTPKMSVHAAGGWRTCLPQVMRELGFETVYMQSAPLPFMFKDQFMSRAGFDVLYGYAHFETMNAYERSHWGVDDRAFFEKTLETVEELHRQEQPFFLTLLTVGTHHPYVFPRGYEGKTYGRKRRALRYADLSIGEFVRGLSASGILEDTLVLITSDESAGMESKNSFKKLEVDGLTDALSQNWGTMIVLGPDVGRRRVREPFGQVDVALSILDYLGHADRGAHFFGRSLFRQYDEPRRMYFANTNKLSVSGLDKQGNLVHCGAVHGICSKYALHDGQVFRSEREPLDYDEERDGVFFEMAKRSVQAEQGDPVRIDYKLLANPSVVIDQPSKQVIQGGQYLDLKQGQWAEVELEIEARSPDNAIVSFWHYMKSGSKTWALERGKNVLEREEFWREVRLQDGQTLKVRYTLAPKQLMQGVRCQSSAKLIKGSEMELFFKQARLSIRWAGRRPPEGIELLEWEVVPTERD